MLSTFHICCSVQSFHTEVEFALFADVLILIRNSPSCKLQSYAISLYRLCCFRLQKGNAMACVKNKPWITYTRKNKKKNTTAEVAQAELVLGNKITRKDGS